MVILWIIERLLKFSKRLIITKIKQEIAAKWSSKKYELSPASEKRRSADWFFTRCTIGSLTILVVDVY